MYKLYYASGACSMPIHILLNEIGAPFEAIKVDMASGEQRQPAFLKINSRGQVPVLQDGDIVIREGAAIITYLCEAHETALFPQEGAEHLAALQAMMFCNATLHPAYGRMFFLNRLDIDAEAKKQALAVAYARIQDLYDDVENTLAKTKYLAGAEMTIADVMFAVFSHWGQPNGLKFGANTQRVIAEVCNMPSFKKANVAEGSPYKAAA